LTNELATNRVRTVIRAFDSLKEYLEQAQIHMEYGDWSSSIRILEAIIDVCNFQWLQSRETYFATPCQQFFQDLRVAWETTLNLATTVPTQERMALMEKLIEWDPTTEFRLPDDWSVIFNECRELHFARTTSVKVIVDVHELWEKMKRTSVTSTQRLHVELSKEECVMVSNANLGIIIAEVERFVEGGDASEINAETEEWKLRASLAKMVAQNGHWRRKLNDFASAAEAVGAIGVDFDDVDLLPPECLSKIRWQHGSMPDTAPLYFWHYICGGGAFEHYETVRDLIQESCKLSQRLNQATVDNVARKAAAGDTFHSILGDSYNRIEAILAQLDSQPKPTNLHQEVYGMVINSARLLRRLNQYTEAINRDLLVKMERCDKEQSGADTSKLQDHDNTGPASLLTRLPGLDSRVGRFLDGIGQRLSISGRRSHGSQDSGGSPRSSYGSAGPRMSRDGATGR